MTSQSMRLSILIGADAAGLRAGGAEAQAALARVRAAANDAGKSIQQMLSTQSGLSRTAAASSLPTDNLRAYGAQLDALRAKYNPLYATIRQYKTEVASIKQAHELGALSTNEMTAAIERERRATLASIDAIKGRNAAIRQTAANQNNAGIQFRRQNLGYQLTDIGQTAALGAPLGMIAAQQVPQILQIYAGAGGGIKALAADLMTIARVAGPVIVAVGAVYAAYRILKANSAEAGLAVDDLTKSLADQASPISALQGKIDDLQKVQQAYTDAILTTASAQTDATRTILANSELEFNAKKALLELELKRQEASLKLQESLLKIEGLHLKQDVAQQVTEPRSTVAGGYSDPKINGGIPFVRVPDEVSGLDKLNDVIAKSPASDKIKEMQANSTLAKLAVDKLREGLNLVFSVGDDVLRQQDESVGKAQRYGDALLKLQKYYENARFSDFEPQGAVPTPAARPNIELEGQPEQLTSYQQLLKASQQRIASVRNEIAIYGQAADVQARMRAGFEAEAQYREQIAREGGTVKPEEIALLREKAGLLARLTAELSAQKAIQSQTDQVDQLRLELQLGAAATNQRAYGLAALQAEVKIRELGLNTASKEAAAIRAQAAAIVDLNQKLSAQKELQSQTDQADEMRLEVQLAGVATDQRARAVAALQAEVRIRELGLNTASKEAEAIRAKAAAMFELNQQLALQKIAEDQQDEARQLQLQASLIGATAQEQARANAVFEVEQKMRQQNIDLMSREADARRAAAVTNAEARLEIERQQAAYQSLQQAEGSAIDTLVSGTGSIKDRLKSMASDALKWFEQIAVANPLKNMLTGTNLPTLSDLFSGKTATTAATTSTAAMTVTAGTVMINGVPLGTTGATGVLGSLFGANNNQPAAANTNSALASVVANAGTTRGGIPLSTIAVNGQTASVNSQYAGNFQGFLTELNASGYKVNDLGGYNYRNIAGTNTLSNHAFGDAIDINPQQNPVRYPGQAVVTDLPPNVQEMAGRYGLEQGMWKSKYDPMHFEVAKGAQPMATDQANASLQKLGQTATATTANVDQLKTGALDASKSLAGGDNSLVGSITKASQTAAQPTAGGSAVAGAAPGGQSIFGSVFGAISSLTKGIGSMISGPMSSLGSVISNIASGAGSFLSTIFGAFANGGAFSNGNVMAFADGGAFTGRIVDRPTLFPMAGGRTGLMGEDGPEGILPLKRGSDGKLGVRASMPRQVREGGSMNMHLSSSIDINVYGNGDAELHAQQREATQQALDQRDKQWADSLPDLIDAYQRDPYGRMRSV